MVIFKAKARKTGRDSFVVTIPKQYISNGLIDPTKELNIEVNERMNE